MTPKPSNPIIKTNDKFICELILELVMDGIYFDYY